MLTADSDILEAGLEILLMLGSKNRLMGQTGFLNEVQIVAAEDSVKLSKTSAISWLNLGCWSWSSSKSKSASSYFPGTI